MGTPAMLNVIFTVDIDVWPRYPDWRASGLERDLLRDFYGVTPQGEFGVPFQIDLIDAHKLKAVFFVDGLLASAAGPAPLQQMISVIQNRGQEVQLHLHPEWLQWM